MAHPAGKGVWRFVHRESGKHLDVIGHTAQEAMLGNTAAFVVAFGELPCWSRLDCSLVSDSAPPKVHAPKQPKPKRRRAVEDAPEILRVVGPERQRFLSGSGRA
jgi:hypothetical protein